MGRLTTPSGGSSSPLESEHRLVTAVFADISGFTALAEQLDSEELLELIDPIVAAFGNVVARYGGYVEKYAGDALLAIFGAPVSHEDDPVRALRVALELQSELERLRGTQNLELHVGVNTGHGIARMIGDEARVDYGVLGEAVVIAQRLESAAPPGSIYVGETTRQLTERSFEFVSIGELELKGKSERVRAWQLIGARSTVSRAPQLLVGRERELAELRRAVEDLGAVVTISGEPGSGKSSLLAAVQEEAEVNWLGVRCVEYGSLRAYRPYVELLQRTDPDPSDPILRYLLGLPGLGVEAFEPDEFRERLQAAYAAWLVARAPVVLAVEDLHWADVESAALTTALMGLTSANAASVIVTTRPGNAVPAGSTLELRPLGDENITRIVRNLLGGEPPEALNETVVERSAGNPFFAEEIVRSLLQAGTLERSDAGWALADEWDPARVPLTIEGVISARIDLLPAEAANLLPIVAVIGRRIPLPLLHRIEPDSGALDVLIASSLLDRVDSDVVMFHHALVQDVAYGRLLRRARRELHRRVAVAAEALYGATEESVDLLARNYDLAEDADKAIEYLTLAGLRAQRLFANEQAVGYFQRALEYPPGSRSCLVEEHLADVLAHTGKHDAATEHYSQALRGADQPTHRARLLRKLGLAYDRQRQGAEAEVAFAGAEEALGPQPSVSDREWWSEWIDLQDARITLSYWEDDEAGMEAALTRAWPVVERAGTPLQRLRFFQSQAMIATRRERYVPSARTIEIARAALKAGLELDDRSRHFMLGFVLLWADQLEEARPHLEEALIVADERGDLILRVRALTYLAILHRKLQDETAVQPLLPLLRAAAEEGALPGYSAVASATEAWLDWRAGNPEAVEGPARAALASWGELRGPYAVMFPPLALWPLLAAALQRGMQEEANDLARRLLDPELQPQPPELAAKLAAGELDEALRLAEDLGRL